MTETPKCPAHIARERTDIGPLAALSGKQGTIAIRRRYPFQTVDIDLTRRELDSFAFTREIVGALTFDLHNRHTYSEEQTRAHRAYAAYTATIGVLTMDNTLVSRAVVQNEFRKATDLIDRIGGGAGPGGVKAVAPTGSAAVTIAIPEAEQQVGILGEKLTVDSIDGTATYASPGRPIAVISNVMIEYRPGPPLKTPVKKKKN